MIYTHEHAEYLKSLIIAPFVRVRLATLGGAERASLMITISLDTQTTWENNILENSRYAKFTIGSVENKLECFSGGVIPVKFRKVKCETVEKIAEKLNAWAKACEELKNSNAEVISNV